MGTAKPLGGLGPNAVGAGRLDLVRATSQQVGAVPGSVSTYLKWPHAATPAQRRTVTYSNSASAAVTLKLNLALTNEAGKPAPAGLAALSATTVTVPAGGQAAVTVTVKAVAGKLGNYVGVLGAATADGKSTVRTPFGVYAEPERYDLSVTVKDRTGAAPDLFNHYVAAINLDSGEVFMGAAGERFRVPPGRYTVLADVATPRVGLEPTLTFLSHPELRVTRDTVLPLDARIGKRIAMRIDQPAAKGGFRVVSHHARTKGLDLPFSFATTADRRFHEFYAASVPGVKSKAYSFSNWMHAEEASVELTVTTPRKFEVAAGWLDLPTPDIDAALGAVYGGQGRPEDLAKIDAKGKLVTLALRYDLTWEDVVERLANVKAAGGRVAFAVPVEADGSVANGFAAGHAAAEPPGLPLPTLFGGSVTTLRFLDLTRKGAATVRLVTKSLSRYRYEVAANEKGRIPAVLNYDRKTRNLAAVRSRYFGYRGVDLPLSVYSTINVGGQELSPFFYIPVPAGSERVEYFTPGLWRHTVANDDLYYDELRSEPAPLRAGATQKLEWNKAVFGPSFTGTTEDERGTHPWVWRTGGLLDVTVPLYGDAAGHTRVPSIEDGADTGTTSLYRNGTLVGTMNTAGRGIFPVPFDESAYRLTTESRRSVPGWPLATRVSAAWTFASSPWGTDALPLLAVGLDPAVNLRNTSPGGRAFTFPARVTRQAGSGTAEVTSLTVRVSYDDGKTWRPATVVRDGAAWKVTVTHPAKGFVSLSAAAADAQGNTVEQTVIRAYQLR
jgi:hypothetical protein